MPSMMVPAVTSIRDCQGQLFILRSPGYSAANASPAANDFRRKLRVWKRHRQRESALSRGDEWILRDSHNDSHGVGLQIEIEVVRR